MGANDIESEIRGYEEREHREYVANLENAHIFAQKALDALYRPNGPKRSLLVRMLLGRAQSILIGLYVQELDRQRKENR